MWCPARPTSSSTISTDAGMKTCGRRTLPTEFVFSACTNWIPRPRAFIEEYCERELDLLLTPVTVDPAHPFPRVINKALSVAFLLRRRRRSALTYTGVVTVPRALPRLVRLPSEGTDDFIFLADLVAFHASRMYHGYDIVSSAAFRVTRNSNLYLAEEESRNLLESVRTELHNRRKGDAVRLEIESDADPEIIERLRTNFELEPWQVFSVNGPVNLSRLFNIYEQRRTPTLNFGHSSPANFGLPPNHRICSRSCAATTSCSITPSTPMMPWFRSSNPRLRIPACFPSSRRFTAPTSIR